MIFAEKHCSVYRPKLTYNLKFGCLVHYDNIRVAYSMLIYTLPNAISIIVQ